MIQLTLLSSPPQTWETDLARVRIGRARDAEVCVAARAGPIVSEWHAIVEFHDGGYQIADAGSRNGTFLDGERVDAPRRLRDGDVIRLGADVGPELRFELLIDRERLAAWATARREERLVAVAVALATVGVLASGLWWLSGG